MILSVEMSGAGQVDEHPIDSKVGLFTDLSPFDLALSVVGRSER